MRLANINAPAGGPTEGALSGGRGRHFPLTHAQPVESTVGPIANGDDATAAAAERAKEAAPEHSAVAVEVPVRELAPLRGAKTRKQRYLTLMQHKLARTAPNPTATATGQHPLRPPREVEISHSALQRERHARRRVAELKVKTCDDIRGRRTTDSDESLGSIRLQEAVTRLQTTRTGTLLPSLGEPAPRARKREISRTRRKQPQQQQQQQQGLAPDSAVALPPIHIDVDVLRELKDSRRRHRNQSMKLPKLP